MEKKKKPEEKRKQRELKRKLKNKSSTVSSSTMGETSRGERGLQSRESTSNECTACFGSYDDDLNSDGTLLREWVQCTNNDCQKWMHEDCAAREDSMLY